MKKLLIIAVALTMVIGFTMLTFAQTNQQQPAPKPHKIQAEIVKGEIVSVDSTNNKIVVKETINVDPKAIGSLKAGEQVDVRISGVTAKIGKNTENILITSEK